MAINPLISNWMLNIPETVQPPVYVDPIETIHAAKKSNLFLLLQRYSAQATSNSVKVRTFDGRFYYIPNTEEHETLYVSALVQDVIQGLYNLNLQVFDATTSCKLYLDIQMDANELFKQIPRLVSSIAPLMNPALDEKTLTSSFVVFEWGDVHRLMFQNIAVSTVTAKRIGQFLKDHQWSVLVQDTETFRIPFLKPAQLGKCTACGGRVEKQVSCVHCHHRGFHISPSVCIQRIYIQQNGEETIHFNAQALPAEEAELRSCIAKTLFHPVTWAKLYMFTEPAAQEDDKHGSKEHFKMAWMSNGSENRPAIKELVSSLLDQIPRFASMEINKTYKKKARLYLTVVSPTLCVPAANNQSFGLHAAFFTIAKEKRSVKIFFTCRTCRIKQDLPLSRVAQESLSQLL